MSKITHIRVLAFPVAPVVLYLDIKLRMLWYRSFSFTPEVMIEGTERRFCLYRWALGISGSQLSLNRGTPCCSLARASLQN